MTTPPRVAEFKNVSYKSPSIYLIHTETSAPVVCCYLDVLSLFSIHRVVHSTMLVNMVMMSEQESCYLHEGADINYHYEGEVRCYIHVLHK